MRYASRVLLFAFVVDCSLLAQPEAAAPALEHYTLPNGMQVVLHVNRRAPVVHLNVRYHVGASHERPGRTGFAHLFEHMIGQGVLADTDFQTEAERIGATDVSGSIHHDFTEFYETVPSGRLERMLWLESERFARLAEKVTQENLDRQRDIVRNELRQKVENRPYGRVNGLLHLHAFPPEHPYGHSIIGSHADLLAATIEDVREFHRIWYTPDNTTLVLAGDLDPAQARVWIEKYYGSIPPGSGIVQPARWIPQLREPKLVDMRDRVPADRFFIAWPAPGKRAPDFPALEAAAFVLTEAGARLAASDVGAMSEILPFFNASLFLIHGAPGPARLEVGEIAVTEEIRKLAADGPGEEEMARARSNLEFRSLSSMETLYGLAVAIHETSTAFGSPEHIGRWMSRYRGISAAAVRDVVRKWIDTPNRLALHVRPETSSMPTEGNAIVEPPPFRSERKFEPPDVKTARLSNGVQIFLVERRELPMVSVHLRFQLGTNRNPPGKEGLALLTLSSLRRGTKSRSGADFDRELGTLAVTLRGSADLETISSHFDVLKRNLPAALDLLSDSILHPSFEPGPFEGGKKEWLDRLNDTAPNPADFHAAAAAISFGRAHPYAGLIFGTPASLGAITAADAVEFHAQFFKPDVAALTFVGDITLEDAVRLATASFGEWSGSAGPAPAVPPAEPMDGRVFLVDRPAAPQSFIVQILPGASRNSPDLAALSLVDKVRGGMFSSRLMQKLRQERGYAYEAGSSLWPLSSHGLWFATSPVQADRTREALEVFLDELRGLGGQRPITAEELRTAKESLIRGYPGDLERPAALADQISRLWAAGRPITDLKTWPETLASVTLDEANAAAKKYARPDKQLFLIYGDRRIVEAAARELIPGRITPIRGSGAPLRQ